MKIKYLIIFFIVGIFVGEGQAMSPNKGGAIGGAAAALAPDVKRCDLKPKEQSKITLRDKSGKTHFLCVGSAICEGKKKEVACEVGEREACPDAKKCVPVPVLKTGGTEIKGTCTMDLKTRRGIRYYISGSEGSTCFVRKYSVSFFSGLERVDRFLHEFGGDAFEEIGGGSSTVDYKFELWNMSPTSPTNKVYLLNLSLKGISYNPVESTDSSNFIWGFQEGGLKPGSENLSLNFGIKRGKVLMPKKIEDLDTRNYDLIEGTFTLTGEYIKN